MLSASLLPSQSLPKGQAFTKDLYHYYNSVAIACATDLAASHDVSWLDDATDLKVRDILKIAWVMGY